MSSSAESKGAKEEGGSFLQNISGRIERFLRKSFPNSEYLNSFLVTRAFNAFRAGDHDAAVAEMREITHKESLERCLKLIILDSWGSLFYKWKEQAYDEKAQKETEGLINKYLSVASPQFRKNVLSMMEGVRNERALNPSQTREEYINRVRANTQERMQEILSISDPDVRDAALSNLAIRSQSYGHEVKADVLSVVEKISNPNLRDRTYSDLTRMLFRAGDNFAASIADVEDVYSKIESDKIRDGLIIYFEYYASTTQDIELLASKLSGKPAVDALYSQAAFRRADSMVRSGKNQRPEQFAYAMMYTSKIEDTDRRDGTLITMGLALIRNEFAPTEVLSIISKISQEKKDVVALDFIKAIRAWGDRWPFSELRSELKEAHRSRMFVLASALKEGIRDTKIASEANKIANQIKKMK